ncbi:Protein kinase superfamily protein [Striga hermonthica]|uniref:1-phosphatidylinositol 4-kinase n=1 Tax=Striga hermonthica TaxID=68872 RepID=A0A9N7NJA9_STRHE|nr:Protein kinase superfamily protein [Striga hermonthica]
MAIALDQAHRAPPLTRPRRCNCRSFPHFDFKMLDFDPPELPHQSHFKSTYINRSLSTPCLSYTDKSSTTNSRIELITGPTSQPVGALILEVAKATADGFSLERALGGLGGAYFLRAQNGQILAVIKPIDSPECTKSPIGSGEIGPRESAAYLLDHGGFSGVPPTALVKFFHFKFGPNCKIVSLQQFVDHESDAGDLGPSGFPVPSVHRIGILDVRLMNLDRHAGNILVGSGKRDLVPIDHGFCLPEFLNDPYFEWLHWPQASVPFGKAEAEYISSLDPYKDAELLRSELPLIKECSIRVLIVCTVFLKRAASHGLCLADIGEMMSRDFCEGRENRSSLEKLCLYAKSRLSEGPTRISSVDLFDDSTDEKVSFGDLKDEEWESFMEIFGGILPYAFDQKKKQKK